LETAGTAEDAAAERFVAGDALGAAALILQCPTEMCP
jgi:hypothetical protein